MTKQTIAEFHAENFETIEQGARHFGFKKTTYEKYLYFHRFPKVSAQQVILAKTKNAVCFNRHSSFFQIKQAERAQ